MTKLNEFLKENVDFKNYIDTRLNDSIDDNIIYDNGLKKTNLLPFTKIKSIDSSIINNTNNFTVTYINTSDPINNYDSNESNIISIAHEAHEASLLKTMENSLQP